MPTFLPIKLADGRIWRQIYIEKCLLTVVPTPLTPNCLHVQSWDSEPEGRVRSTGAATFTQAADSGQKGTDKAESPVLVEFKKIVVKYT